MLPELAARSPDKRLISVDLPAPFGPSNAWSSPCARSRHTASLATRPPKRRVNARAPKTVCVIGPPRLRPQWPMRPLRCPLRGSNSRRGAVTRAAGEGPRKAGIDGQCESSHEADCCCNDSRRRSKEAGAPRRSWISSSGTNTPNASVEIAQTARQEQHEKHDRRSKQKLPVWGELREPFLQQHENEGASD